MKKLLLLLSLFIAAQSYAQNVPAYVPTNGLVGWWPFSGNAIDSSGNGNNGTVNGATLTTDRFGNANSAYLFNGISNNIVCNPILLNNNQLTLSVWVLNKRLPSNGEYKGLVTTQPNSNMGFLLQDNETMKYDYTLARGGSYVDLWSNSSIDSSQWVNIVCVFTANQMKFYYNSILESTLSVSNIFLNSTAQLYFGSRYLSEYYKGKLDDIGIWNRALNNSEISALYNYTPSAISNTSIDNQTTYAFYPNPTNSLVNVNNFSIGMHLKAYSIYGQLLTESDTNQIDISNLSNGNYFVLLFDEKNQFIKSEMIYKK
jgi:hypothetical protein